MSQGQEMPAQDAPKDIPSREMIAQIVSAYAQRPDVDVSDIVRLTQELTATLGSGAAPATAEAPEPKPAKGLMTPVIPLEEAVSEDAVTCLCCGKSFKTLKRHLMAAHGMTEADYRAAFGLPDDFPIVAPSYSDRRSQVASESGFGTYDRANRGQQDVAQDVA